MKWIKGTRWLITGGTSGLGLALTQMIIENGGQAAVVARNEKKLFELAAQHSFIPIAGDVSKKQDIYKISGQALAQLGRIDYLVNNASSLGVTPLRPLLDTDCETIEDVFSTNLLGPFRLTKAILPSMLLNKRGTIITISSDAAVSAYPHWGPYGASKAALDHLFHIWAEELKEKNVRIFALDPGDMDTPMHALAIPEADPTSLKKPETSALQLLNLLSENQNSWLRKSL